MHLEPNTVYIADTQTSRYTIDTANMRAKREPLPAHAHGAGPTPTPKPLFVGANPIALAEVPQVTVGEPMRLKIHVPAHLLDHNARGKPTAMVTTTVTHVTRAD